MKQKLLAVLCCVGAYVLSAQEHRLAVSASGVIPCKNFNDIKFATANSMSEFLEGEHGKDKRCEEPENPEETEEPQYSALTLYTSKNLREAPLEQLQADAFRGLPALPLDLVGLIEDFMGEIFLMHLLDVAPVSATDIPLCKELYKIEFATANSMSEFLEGEHGKDKRCEEPDPEYPDGSWKRYLVVPLEQIQADLFSYNDFPKNIIGLIEEFVDTIYLHKELPKASLNQLQADTFRGLPALPLDLVGIIEDFAPSSFKLTAVLPSSRNLIHSFVIKPNIIFVTNLVSKAPTILTISFVLGGTLEALILQLILLWKKKGIAREFLGQQCASVYQYILNRSDHGSPVTVRFNEDGVVTESDLELVKYESRGLFSTFSISSGSDKKRRIIKNRVARVLDSQNCATFPLPDDSTFIESVPESLRSNITRDTESVAVLNTSNTSEVAIGYKNGEVRVFLRDDWLKNFIKSPENFYAQEKVRQQTINRARRKSWLRYLAFTSISVAATIVTLISIIRVNDYIAGGFSRCIAAFLRNR